MWLEKVPLQAVHGQEQGVTSKKGTENSCLHFTFPQSPSSKVPLPQMFPPPPVVPVQLLGGMKSTSGLVWC